MAMDKFPVPDEAERRIIERNGIDLDKVPMAVIGRTENVIYLKVHRTGDELTIEPMDDGDEITIRQGLKKWKSY